MRQHTLTSALNELYEFDFNMRFRVEAQASGDTNAPTWGTVLAAINGELQQLNAEARVKEAAAYEQTVTHQVFLQDSAYLKIGYRLVETHHKTDMGAWVAVSSGAEKWLIVGKEKVPAIPAVYTQVRLALSLYTKVG